MSFLKIHNYNNIIQYLFYRNSIFIFISNIGGHEIASNLLDLYEEGVKRDEVAFHNFEPIIRRTAYHQGKYVFYLCINLFLVEF